MGFIIRSAFWLSLVLLIIPLGGAEGEQPEEVVGPVQAFFAAKDAVSDIAGMCERKPEVCEVGRSALATIGTRAREGARIAMTMIEEDQDGPEEVIVTGSIPDSD